MPDFLNRSSAYIYWRLVKPLVFVKLYLLELMLNLSKISSCFSGFTICEGRKDSWQTLKTQLAKMKKYKIRVDLNKKTWIWTYSHLFQRLLYFSIMPFPSPTLCYSPALPTGCESCFLLSKELELSSSKIFKLTEADVIILLENVCAKFSQYKIHNDKDGVARFSLEESQTMNTLKQLKERGVKVKLGLPDEMWDGPTVEATELRQQCELIVAEYEDDLTWFLLDRNGDSLQNFLCRSRYLVGRDLSCLSTASSGEL